MCEAECTFFGAKSAHLFQLWHATLCKQFASRFLVLLRLDVIGIGFREGPLMQLLFLLRGEPSTQA